MTKRNMLGDYATKDDYFSTITPQLTFSEAKFIIENPQQANDDDQVYLAGAEGVLKTYQNIKVAKPKVKIEALEQLLLKQQTGQLPDFVKSATDGCQASK